MKQEAKKTDLQVVANNPLLTTGMGLDDLAADAGSGSQNVTAKDTATPLLRLLQDNSPEVKKIDSKYINGAQAGFIHNNVTNEVYNGTKGITVVPCYFEKVFIEWRSGRGGLQGVHPVNTPLKDQITMTGVKQNDGSIKIMPLLPNGNSLIETNQHYVLMLKDDGSYEAAVIPMASTQLRCSRTWNTLVKKVVLQRSDGTPFNPASYYCQYKLTTKGVQKGDHSWYIYHVESLGAVATRTIYDIAKALEHSVAMGGIKPKHEDTIYVPGEDISE